MTSAPDWIAALGTLLATVIAGAAAWIGLATFRSQRTVSDVQLAYTVFSEINRYWDRLSEIPSSYEYNMGQILAQFEIASALFNKGILTDNATVILGDHIVEVFSQISNATNGKNLFDVCRSSPNTFKELHVFIARKMPQALNAQAYQTRQ